MPVDIAWEALVGHATFVARSFAGDPKQVKELIKAALAMMGSLCWILSARVSYYNPPQTEGKLGEDWYDQSWTGIAGDVTVEVLNRNHIREAFIITETIVEREAALQCKIDLRNAGWERFTGSVEVEISEWLPEALGPIAELPRRWKHCLCKMHTWRYA